MSLKAIKASFRLRTLHIVIKLEKSIQIIHNHPFKPIREGNTEIPSFRVLAFPIRGRFPYHQIKEDEYFLPTNKHLGSCSTLNDNYLSDVWMQQFFLVVFYLANVKIKTMKQIQVNQKEQNIKINK